MKAAIDNFAKMDGDKKVLLLGGMMELGDESVAEHTGIIDQLNRHTWSDVILVGGDFAKIKHRYIYLNNAAEAKDWLQKKQFKEAKILVKGSRSMQMEKVLD